MSEETKDQVQSENVLEPQGDSQQEPLILGKFKDVDALKKSYTELERKLGDRPPQQEPPKQDNPAPEKEEYEWQKQNAAMDAQAALTAKRKQEVATLLADNSVLSAVRRALGDADSIAEFEQEFASGQVTASEVRRLAKVGGYKKENVKTIPDSKEDVKSQAQEAEVAYMMKMLKNSNSAYFNQKASDHKHVVAKVNEIKSRLGM